MAGTGVTVSNSTGAVTLSIGQSVATTASPTFGNITASGSGDTSIKINSTSGYAIQYFSINGTNKWHYEVTPSGGSWSLIESGVAARLTVTPTTMTASGNIVAAGYVAVGGTGYTDAGSVSASGWFRSKGQTGWYSQDYGGGIYMIDTTWVRVYNSKNFYCDQTIRAAVIQSEGADDGLCLRPWTANGSYSSLSTRGMAGTEYALLSDGTHTFVSAGSGGYTTIRAGSNDTSGQIVVSPSTVSITGNMYLGSVSVNDSTDYVSRDSSNGRVHVKSSNRDLKENIISVSGALDTIKKLSPKTFNWKLTEEDIGSEYKILTKQTYRSMGFILEEVLDVSPELITWRTNPEDNSIYPGYWKIDDFIALSIQGIKELNEKILILESEIKELREKK